MFFNKVLNVSTALSYSCLIKMIQLRLKLQKTGAISYLLSFFRAEQGSEHVLSRAHSFFYKKSHISFVLCVCGDCSCQNKCAVNYISLDVLVADTINSSNTVKCTVSPYMYLCLVTLRQMSCHDIMPDFSPGNVNSLPLNMLDLI